MSSSNESSSYSSPTFRTASEGTYSKLKMGKHDVTESPFRTASEGTHSKSTMGNDDVFESSDCQPENDENVDIEKSGCTTANSSMASTKSKEELEAVWAKLHNGTKEVCKQAEGILYMERYEGFIRNNWPYDVKRRNLCHPRALSLAGLAFHSLEPAPSAQCVVCLKILKNLDSNSNPWILHTEISPGCYFVQLGQRDEADDYTMDEMLEMIFKKIYNEARQQVQERENNLKKQLFALRKHEKALGLKDDN